MDSPSSTARPWMSPKSRTANSTPLRNAPPSDAAPVIESNERICTASSVPSGWIRDSVRPATGVLVQIMLLILRLAAGSVGSLEETGSRSEHAPRVKVQMVRENRADFMETSFLELANTLVDGSEAHGANR